MEEKNIAAFPRPVYHRIPNFIGAQEAAQKLRELPEFKLARTVFCNPDAPQRYVREIVLRDGKQLVMATPKLRQGFLLIDPNSISASNIREASTIRGAFKHGNSINPANVKIDLFVAGSVAVSPNGGRLGKGTGYSDKEYSILKDAKGLSPHAIVATTVHDVQVVENISANEWDVPVDVIVTPTRVIRITK
jgi:5-formyltetrahydrofolate cyclo-ligase